MEIEIPVRSGLYQYVLVHGDGTSTTIPVSAEDIERGSVQVTPGEDHRVMEVALSSTSDPDLEPAIGQLWPPLTA